MWIDAKGSTVLPAPECLRLLALSAKAGGIGRLGVATDHAPVVIPVNFSSSLARCTSATAASRFQNGISA